MIDEQDLFEATGGDSKAAFRVDGLDMAGSNPGHSIIGFLDDRRFLADAAQNPALRAVLVNADLADEAKGVIDSDVALVVVDDPRWSFYMLHNHLALRREASLFTSAVHATAVVHPSAQIDPLGVVVGAGTVVEEGAILLRSAVLGDGVVIRAGAVIGASGFEHKRTSRGVLSVVHDGETRIGSGTEVGSLTVVTRGFARRHTEIGEDSRLDCNVMVAHASQLGDRVFVAAGAVIAGSAQIGDDVWIGPGATLIDRVRIGDSARVGIGSVVFRDVADGQQVLGNPARPVTRS